MALRRSFKLIWRLFLPLVVLLWTIIGLMLWYTIRNETDVRKEILESQLNNVNATLLAAYEEGKDLHSTLEFIDEYNDNTVFDNLRVSVFNENSTLIASVGTPIVLEDADHQKVPEVDQVQEQGHATSVRESLTDRRKMMFNVMTSNDGAITVFAGIPYNARIAVALDYDPMIWMLVFALALVATVIAYVIAHRLSSVVNNLHRFAMKASSSRDYNIESMKFPKDEIGDVAREIVRLYREKDKATQRMEHEHEVALRANEEKARIKRQTANNLNHEIKTPVGIIKGYLDTINSDPDMPEGLRQSFLKKAQEHADRLTQLLKDVSSITRLEDGSQQVETTDFDFHDLIYNIASDLEVSNINEGLEFEWNIPFDTIVRGNYTLLNNAIMNLVRNAAKYSKGTRISLNLIGERDDSYTFSFADDGTGVGEEHLSHLFDRFYRVDEGRSRKSGGTGLGLPIVKSTFQALGGEITVHNAKPHGLEFVFTLQKASTEPLPENDKE